MRVLEHINGGLYLMTSGSWETGFTATPDHMADTGYQGLHYPAQSGSFFRPTIHRVMVAAAHLERGGLLECASALRDAIEP